MPFTFSHPLFAVPLRRLAPKWLSITGLVLGSMIPDMEYFMAMVSYQTIGHSLRGFLLQGLPLSIAFAFAFHTIMKPVLPKFLPSARGLAYFAKSMTTEHWQLRSARAWTIFLVSLFIGYWTHIFMDAWTHSSGVFVGKFTFLQRKIAGERVYQLLQYLFSLIGVLIPGLLLLLRYQRWYARVKQARLRLPSVSSLSVTLRLWGIAATFGLLLFAAKWLFSVDQANWISVLIVAPLSSALFGIFAACLLQRAAEDRKFKRAVGALGLLVLSIVLFRGCEFIWAPKEVFDPYSQMWKAPKGVSQTLWNGYMWCWSALVLWSCLPFIRKGSGRAPAPVANDRSPSG